MGLTDSVRVALGALASKKLRTFLTMLGVVIGVGAVIALMSVGQGARQQITSQIKGLGSNLVFIRPGSTQQAGLRLGQGTAPTLTLEDAEELPDLGPEIVDAVPEQFGSGQVIGNGQNAVRKF